MKIWLGLKNVMSPRIAEEPRCFLYICDLLGHHADGPSRHYVRSNGVVGENDLVHSSRSAVERTVSFHANDSVGDDEVRADCRTDVQDALVDARPMQNVLRPTVTRPGNDAEHVFHAECDSGPVVCFHFRHRHDEVRCQNGSWKPQMTEVGIIRLKLGFDQVVAIEIDEADFAVRKLVTQASLVQEQIRVAVMPWPFADSY